MEECTKSCDYVHDPTDSESWVNDVDRSHYTKWFSEELSEVPWECPHGAKENEDYCIFHLPVEEKDDGEVTTKLLETIKQAGERDDFSEAQRDLEFVGAKFGDIEIDRDSLSVDISGDPVLHLEHSKIEGELNIARTSIEITFDISGSVIEKPVSIVGTQFKRDVWAMECEIIDSAEFRDAIFDNEAVLQDIKFESEIEFVGVIFNGQTSLASVFSEGVSFSHCSFNQDVTFADSVFKSDSSFMSSKIEDKSIFIRMDTSDDASLNFRNVDLTGCRFTHSDISGSNFEGAILAQADFVDADMTGVKLYGATTQDAQINEDTTFGHHYENNSKKSMWTERVIEKLSRENDLPEQASEAYIRRKEERLKQIRRDGISSDLIWAELSRVVIGYGEKPEQVAKTATAVIILSTFLYPLFGGIRPIDGSKALNYPPLVWQLSEIPPYIVEVTPILYDSFYFSVVTFTTLGFGDFQPVGIGRLLATGEAAAGVTLFALLVFVLGRKATQ